MGKMGKALTVLSVVGSVMLTDSALQAGWRDVMTHRAAAKQPTEVGRSLVELQRIGTRIHIGYGDYTANSGPIDVLSYHTPARRLVNQGLRLNTEAILNYRRIGSRVFAVSADPRDLGQHNYASAHVKRATRWSRLQVTTKTSSSQVAVHLYDIAWFDRAYWAAGGMANNHAGLWRSTDRGRTWSLVLNIAPQSKSPNDTARFYFIGQHRKKLYVQAFDHCDGSGCAHPRSWVFDGDKWQQGPDLLRNFGMGYAPVRFRGEMIMRSNENSYYAGVLLAFDGYSARNPLPWQDLVHDFAVGQDGYLYVLTADTNPDDGVNGQHILRTNDLATWECIFDAPRRATARTIEVVRIPNQQNRVRSRVFLGTTHSSLVTRWVPDRSNCDGWW